MKIAIIRLRGAVNKSPDLKATLRCLRLHHKNQCVVVEDSPSLKGMFRKIIGVATWGKISESLIKELVEKRGRKDMKMHFKLAPPKQGFERGGIRRNFKIGGACGNRGEGIEELIRRMM